MIRPSFYDLDWMGIVSNISYVRWTEDIRTRLLDMSPYPMSRLMAERLSPALLRTTIDYKQPYDGERGGLIRATVKAGERTGRSRWDLVYQFYHAETDQQLVVATQAGCFVALPEVKPTRIPPEMRDFLTEYLAPETRYELPLP